MLTEGEDKNLCGLISSTLGASVQFHVKSFYELLKLPFFEEGIKRSGPSDDLLILLVKLTEADPDPFGHLLPKMYSDAYNRDKDIYEFLSAYVPAKNFLETIEEAYLAFANHVFKIKFQLPNLFSKLPTPSEDDLAKFNEISNLPPDEQRLVQSHQVEISNLPLKEDKEEQRLVQSNQVEIQSETQLDQEEQQIQVQEQLDLQQQKPRLFKITLMGASNCGKTQILSHFVDNSFSVDHIMTIGIDFKSKLIAYDNCPVKLQFWDSAGHERYQAFNRGHYRNCQGVLLVYDITNLDSFYAATQSLFVQANCSAIILLGNKTDLEHLRKVDKNLASTWATQQGTLFMEVSAKTGENVCEAIEMLYNTMKEQNIW